MLFKIVTDEKGVILEELIMSRIEKSIRNRRYHVKHGKNIETIVDLTSGDKISGELIDCSTQGFKANFKNSNLIEDNINLGDIWPAAKFKTEKGEYFLGRIVVRRFFRTQSSDLEISFSVVDSRVPVNSHLSHYIAQSLDNNDHFHEKEINPEKFSLANFIENENSHVDLFERMKEFSVFQKEWEKTDKYGYKMVREPSFGQRVNLVRQRKDGRNDYIVMGSNDYLGLSSHPEVIAATKKALDKYGFGSTGSPATTGTTILHNELNEKLARIHGKEAALLFNSGYASNIGIINAVTTTNDLIVADQYAHASIQDGMQMSKATSRFFKHNDVKHLRSILEKERTSYNGALVITEGVFSMDGDLALLDEIYKVAREFNCRVMVDQAHCFGVIGPNGLGIVDKYNLSKEVDIIMGTFSKVCGGIGGYVAGSKELIEWIRFFGRSQLFSISLPPSNVAAVSAALDIFTSDRSLLNSLKANIRHFTKGLESIGFKFKIPHESSIVPVLIGDEQKMGTMYQSMLNDGVWCVPIIYPAVSKKNCRFRFTVMASHTISELDYVVSSLEKAMLKAQFSIDSILLKENSKAS